MDIQELVRAQRAYFDTGATRPYAFRLLQLKKLQQALRDNEQLLEQAMMQDFRKAPMEVYMCETGMVLEELRFHLKHLKGWMRERAVPTPLAQFPAKSFVSPEPYGVALIISPWNYPVQLCLSPLVGAISGGNCAVVKPSAYAPATSAAIAKLIRETFDARYIAAVEGGRAENSALLAQRFDTIFFTGSVAVGKVVAVDSYEGGGQADVQMVLVVDDANKTWQVLQINRDTITKVPVLDVLGGVAAYADEQIALAHYYGNGRENSCENTALAVSMLLDDQPIDGYFALNMDAVGIVTDLVGGVTLTVTSDFSEIDPTLVQGEEVTLDGEKALTYVRSRHHIDDQTNIARMARQRQFLAALEEKLRQQDSQFAAEAYTALEDYMVTDIASGTAAKIGEKLKQYKQLDTLTIDGENVIENGYWAYHLDESSREATVLQLFYEKVR